MLHPQARALLDLIAERGVPPTHTLSPQEARAVYRDRRGFTQPAPPPVASVQSLQAEGPLGPIPLRLYRPLGTMADQVLPALVYYHGGGWVIGDLDTHDTLCRELANGSGCAVVSVDYRLAPEHRFPAAVDDAIAAARWVRREAAALKLDAQRIAVGGDSAGGNLAAVVALSVRGSSAPPLAFQLLIYPATDMRAVAESHRTNAQGYILTADSVSYYRGHYIADPAQWSDWRASPLLAPDLKGLPPALVITAGYDPLRDEGFGWFYLAVNVGYVCGPLLAEWCRARWGWSAVLLLTMLAMSSGLVVAMFARGHLSASRHKPAVVSHGERSPMQEKQRLHALVLVCGLAVVFFMAIQQTGGPLALFAQDQTARLLVVGKWSLELRPGHYATLHGLFVLLLLPLLNLVFARLRSYRREPSTAAKLAWGFFFTTAAFGLMIVASSDNHTLRPLVSPYWLVGFYVMLSVGELLLSPMGLSLVTGLAPAGRAGRMVGWWYASVALGYWVAGAMGWLWSRWPHRHYFALVVAMLMIAAGVLVSRLRSLDMALRSMHEHTPK